MDRAVCPRAQFSIEEGIDSYHRAVEEILVGSLQYIHVANVIGHHQRGDYLPFLHFACVYSPYTNTTAHQVRITVSPRVTHNVNPRFGTAVSKRETKPSATCFCASDFAGDRDPLAILLGESGQREWHGRRHRVL